MKIKNILAAFAAAAAMLCGVTGCAGVTSGSPSNGSGLSSGSGATNNGMPVSPGVLRGSDKMVYKGHIDNGETYTVGISRLMDHPALNLAEEGFVQAMIDSGFTIGSNLIIEYRNANGESQALDDIASEFVDKNVDLMFAIATPAAQACKARSSKIPIIATAVTDFIDAKLADSNSRPGTNVSGTTDMSPIDSQLALMLDFVGNVNTVGLFYTASESNSVLQANIARQYLTSKGLSIVEKTINSADEIETALNGLASQCDAVYIPTDNLLAAEMETVGSVAKSQKLPVVCGDSSMVETGGLATLGLDYYDLGYQAGIMAVKVLDGTTAIDRMPIQKSSKYEYTFNKNMIEALGIPVPDKYQQYMQ